MSVHHARSGDIIGISFLIFFNMKVYCVFSLESPYQGDSNEYRSFAKKWRAKNRFNFIITE